MNSEKTRSTRCVETHMGWKATQELIRAIQEKKAPPVSSPGEHGVRDVIEGSTADKEE